LLEGPAAEDQYFSWLANTNILIAPYVSPKYVRSTSGVFVEALFVGVPAVVMRGTWAGDIVEDAARKGLEIGGVAERLTAVPERVQDLASQLAYYENNLRLFLAGWKHRHSASVAEVLLACAASPHPVRL
jgi:glycosyltransferase involved in cell wall biosynthesis